MRTICKPVCLWVLIFSLGLLALGCTPEEKEKAFKLYSGKCGSCHRLLPLDDYSIAKFEEYIEKYGKALTDSEKNQLLSYIKEYKSKIIVK